MKFLLLLYLILGSTSTLGQRLLHLSFLTCSEGDGDEQCPCPLEDTRWSSTFGGCVAIAGSSCSEALGCTDNAFCNYMSDWTCICDSGFSRTFSTGECLPFYNSPCHPDKETFRCNDDEFLKCSARSGESDPDEAKCQCDEGRIWNKNLKMCLALVGQKCDLKVTADMGRVSECTSGASCVNQDPNRPKEGICKCADGFKELGNKQCSSSSFLTGRIFLISFLSFCSYLLGFKEFLD